MSQSLTPRAARMVLSGLAALVLGSALAGCESGPSGSVPPPAASNAPAYADPKASEIVVARVGDRAIKVRDIDETMRIRFAQMKDLQGADAVHQKWEILLSMFDQYLWVRAGEKRGMDKEEEFVRSMELSRNFILSSYTIRRMVHEQAKPTDDEVRSYFEENEDQFRQAARAQVDHLLAASRGEAEQLRRRALAGEDFADLVRRHSTDQVTKSSGGSMGPVGTASVLTGFDQAYPELNRAIFATPAGGITEPVSTPRGWSIFRVNELREARVTSLEEARAGIEKKLQSKKSNEIFASILDEVRRETQASIDTAAWRDYAFRVLGKDEVYALAESERRPEHRIGWLREYARRLPEDPRSPQALFLAAFSAAEDVRDYVRARGLFEEMIRLYPQHELVPSARWMIENMEKGLENLPYAEELKRRAAS